MSSDRIIKLVQLQDLELMIHEAQDPARKENEEALGFTVANIEKLEAGLEELRGQIEKADDSLSEIRVAQCIAQALTSIFERLGRCRGGEEQHHTHKKRGLQCSGDGVGHWITAAGRQPRPLW